MNSLVLTLYLLALIILIPAVFFTIRWQRRRHLQGQERQATQARAELEREPNAEASNEQAATETGKDHVLRPGAGNLERFR